MNKLVAIAGLSVLLSACGSDDEQPTIDVDLSEFKGVSSAPNFTAVAVSDNDAININTRAAGTVAENGNVDLYFTASGDELVAVTLSSGAEDLDLYIENSDINSSSTYSNSNEAIVFPASLGETYNLGVAADVGAGDFILDLVSANRSSLGLSENEFWVSFTSTYSDSCNGEDPYTYSDLDGFVINFAEGYIASPDGLEKRAFSSVEGLSFNVSFSSSGSGEGFSYSSTGSSTYTVNPLTGGVTGSGSYSSSELNNGQSYECTGTTTYDGGIVL